MSFLSKPGAGESINYGGQRMELMTGPAGASAAGFAMARMTLPPHFRGPVPHAHDEFDEAILVVAGRLMVLADRTEDVAEPGALLMAPRGQRHGFANPFDEPVEVLTLWSPGELGIRFMIERGEVITDDSPPDPEAMAEFYARHASRLLP